ncbi:helix-turn-helix transcriptional regulator [Micromonospora tulbaghiae]|uniref:helix-turn-helix domain-containing protein n=1 Tax=Micromonospora tulbaghiae TaxID=479978 RepID=UPI0033D5E786
MVHQYASPAVDGPRIRALRIQSGLSVTDLARRIGITPQYLSQIENKHRPTVSPQTFAKFLAAMGVEDREILKPSTSSDDRPAA